MRKISQHEFFMNIETIIYEHMKNVSSQINKELEQLAKKIHFIENELENISSLFFWKKNAILKQFDNLRDEHQAKESYLLRLVKETSELNIMLQKRTQILENIPDYEVRIKNKYEYIVEKTGINGQHHPEIQKMISKIYEQSLMIDPNIGKKTVNNIDDSKVTKQKTEIKPKKTEDILRMYVGRKYHEKYGVDKIFELACFLGSEKIRNKLNLGNIYSKPETVEKFIEEITAKIPYDVFSEIQKFWTEEKQKNMDMYNLLKTQENTRETTSNLKM